MESEFLSWAYWGADKSEVIRNLGIVLVAFIGLPFLIWRSIAAHITAKAALTTSMASLRQSEALLTQTEVANKQADAALNQSKNAEKQTEILLRNQFLEYLIKGFDQLSSENPNKRIGAIYILERLAETSEQDRYPILRALQLYLKSSSGLPYADFLKLSGIDEESLNSAKEKIETPEMEDFLLHLIPESYRVWPTPSPDIQAIAEILGGNIRKGLVGKNTLFFSGVNLCGLKLFGLDFSECTFRNANLAGIKADGANFEKALLSPCILIGASLRNANLKGARLDTAKLIGADLEKANLTKASFYLTDLERANLKSANLSGAVFEHTNLSGANLTDVVGLEQSQLDHAYGDLKTILPDGLSIKGKITYRDRTPHH